MICVCVFVSIKKHCQGLLLSACAKVLINKLICRFYYSGLSLYLSQCLAQTFATGEPTDY